MHRALLDTDILSEILKRKYSVVAANAAKYAAILLRYTFSAVSVHEIIYGLQSKGAVHQLAAARAAFAVNDVIIPTLDDYEVAGTTRGRARRQGHQLAMDDCLIAAIAARLSIPLVTGNTDHFKAAHAAGLSSLILENWRLP